MLLPGTVHLPCRPSPCRYAGKKLRKWYGQEGQVLPRDGREGGPGSEEPEEEEEEEAAVREYVAVLDADSSPMAEQVVLQLILNRTKIRALVKDAAAAKAGFGPYIEAVQGDSGDRAAVARLLRGAKAAVCCGKLGALLPAAAATRLPHAVLLSSAGAPQQGFALFASSEQQALADPAREPAAACQRPALHHRPSRQPCRRAGRHQQPCTHRWACLNYTPDLGPRCLLTA